jgi:hypothetical protein
MNSFVRGMGSLNILPPPKRRHKKTAGSAWQGVGMAFWAVGNNLRTAIDEQPPAQLVEKPTTRK